VAQGKTEEIQRAQALGAQGQLDRAIDELRQLLDNSPNDANVYTAIGDLYLTNKLLTEAIDAYGHAAVIFIRDGVALKAIAVFKKILKLDPNRGDIYIQLGDLNAERGLMSNAIADYLSGAKLYLKAGKGRDALDVYRKITKINPSNISVRLRVADLCLRERLIDEAIEEFLRAGEEYERLQKHDDAHKLYEKILKVSPNHAEAQRRLGVAVIPAAGEIEVAVEPSTPVVEAMPPETGRAEEPVEVKLEGVIEFSPEELETLSTPAPAAPSVSGAPESLEETQRLLAVGDVAQAERIIRTLLLKDPERNEYKATLGLVYLKKGNAAIAYDVLYPIAQAWAEEGRHQDALELADAFLAVEPDEPDFLALKTQVAEVSRGATPAVEALEVVGLGETVPDIEPVPVAEVIVPAAEVGGTAEAPGEPAVASGATPKREGELDTILQEFREGIKEQLEDEDVETHYDLGNAYKEMGLLTEAIEEFQVAAQGPTRFNDSSAMIAACYKEQGANQSAIACLEDALADSRCQGPTAPYLKYDLALLYEEEGHADKAMALYSGIPTIRDAAERLARLQGAAHPADSPQGTESRRISYL
jgi:tetratricopeptide (TPR) repeat protein